MKNMMFYIIQIYNKFLFLYLYIYIMLYIVIL